MIEIYLLSLQDITFYTSTFFFSPCSFSKHAKRSLIEGLEVTQLACLFMEAEVDKQHYTLHSKQPCCSNAGEQVQFQRGGPVEHDPEKAIFSKGNSSLAEAEKGGKW